MLRGLIFDLDGVLVDTARFHYLAWKRLAEEWFSLPFTERDNEAFKGVNREACMRMLAARAASPLSDEAFEEAMAAKNRWYVERVARMTEADVLPGARAFIEAARARGLRLAIGSASKNCALVIERTGLSALFDAVADGTVVARAKPDPEVFLAAARMLALPPREVMVFEDAQAGIDAALAGGFYCCAVGRPEDLTGYDRLCPGLFATTVEEMISVALDPHL